MGVDCPSINQSGRSHDDDSVYNQCDVVCGLGGGGVGWRLSSNAQCYPNNHGCVALLSGSQDGEIPVIYLASTYSHASPGIMEIRYRQAEKAMAQMLLAGDVVYSAIAMTHHAARKYELPKDSLWWRAHNYSMLRLASELRVLRIPGWHESKGVRDEIALAKHLNIPISYWDEQYDIWIRDASADRMRILGGNEGVVHEEGA